MEYIKIEKEYVLDRQTTAVLTEDLPLHWVCSWSADPSSEYKFLLKFVLVNSDSGIDRRTAVTYVKLYNESEYDASWEPLPPNMCIFTFVNHNSENVIEVYAYNFSKLKFVFEINIPKNSSIFYDLSKENAENDGILVVGVEKFYINKAILSAYSPIFNNLFNNENFEESKMNEIELKELDSQEFRTLLQVIFPSNVTVNANNVEFLWKLADRFDIISVAKVCENVLCNMEGKRYGKFSIDNRMRIAELYDSDKLKNVLIQQMENMNI